LLQSDVVVIVLNADHLLKFIDLRKTPSLEFGMMLIFSYSPYALAEGLHLSGKKFCEFLILDELVASYGFAHR